MLSVFVAALFAINCSFSQDTVCPAVSIPWNEDFAITNEDSLLINDCWQLGGSWFRYTYSQWSSRNDEDGNPITSGVGMMTNTPNSYLITPPIAIPTNNVERLKLWIAHLLTLTAVVSTDGGLSFTDTIYHASHSGVRICLRSVPLSQYAGQTIMVKLILAENNTAVLDRVGVDYDTALRVNISVPTSTYNDSTVLCTAALRYGDTVGLSFNWSSSTGGVISTNALGDSAWITYPSGFSSRNDVVSVVAFNNYNSDTATGTIRVIDCTPATNLPWLETFADGLVCWHKPNGSNWIDETHWYDESTRALSSWCQANAPSHWIMSKEIHIPSDTNLMVVLGWDVASTDSNYLNNYSLWISTGGDYTDTANYNLFYLDTSRHVPFPNLEHLQLSLNEYAGDTIHLALRNETRHETSASATLFIDNVSVRSIASPEVSIHVPSDVYTGDPVCNAEGTLVEGSASGLTIFWRSSYYSSTVGGLQFPLAYSAECIDTLTFVASNNFGADSVRAIVHVHDCPAIISIPFEEPFDIGYSFGCWRNWNLVTNPNALYNYDWRMLTVDNRSAISLFAEYPYLPDFFFTFQFNSWFVTPAIALPSGITGVNLDFDVRGYINGYPRLKILLSTTGGNESDRFTDTLYNSVLNFADWRKIHIPLDEYAGQTINIAFVNDCNSRGVHLDSLLIGYTYLPQASISHNDAFVDDTTCFIAGTYNCVRDNLNIQWHSSLLDTIFQSGLTTLDLVYPVAGTDTLTLVVSNLYGSDTAVAIFDVMVHPLPSVSAAMPSMAVVGDSLNLVAAISDCSRNGLYYGWHSSLLGVTINDTVWRFSYPYGGVDTLTFVIRNNYGSDSVSASFYVFDCGAADLPYYEAFDNVIYAGLSLPYCWSLLSNGVAGSVMPRIKNSYLIDGDSNYYLSFFAGNSTYYTQYGTEVKAVLPRFSRPLQELSLSLDYSYGNENKGKLIVGSYNDSLQLFTPFDTLSPHSGSFVPATVNFSTSTADSSDRIALCFAWNGSASDAIVDNILVRGLPNVAINGPATVGIGDNVVYSATITELTDSVTSVVWNSAMLSRGEATALCENGLLYVVYNVEGTDTLSLTITTNIDTVTAFNTVSVFDMTPVSFVYAEEQGNLCDTVVAVVYYYRFKNVDYTVRWFSNMAGSGEAVMMPSGDTLRIAYLSAGVDTVMAVVENVYGIDSSWRSVPIEECDTVWRIVAASIVMVDGSDVPDGLEVTGTGIYNDSSLATLTAVYPSDIAFICWITPIGDTVYSNPYSFMVFDDAEILALFRHMQSIYLTSGVEPLVYPNPAIAKVTIVSSQEGLLTVFDPSGRKLASLPLRQGHNLLDVSGLSAGICFLQFDFAGGRTISKLVISR